MISLLFLLIFPVLSCVHSQSEIPNFKNSKPNVIVLAYSAPLLEKTSHPKTEAPARILLDRISEETKSPVEPIVLYSKKSPLSLWTPAAKLGGNILFWLRPSSSENGGHLLMDAYQVTTGTLIQDFSAPFIDTEHTIQSVLEWTKSIQTKLKMAQPLKMSELAWRLEKEQKCEDLADLISYAEESQPEEVDEMNHTLIHCRPQLLQHMEIAKSYLVELHTKGLPEKFLHAFSDASWNSSLGSKVLDISTAAALLDIHCINECQSGVIRLPSEQWVIQAEKNSFGEIRLHSSSEAIDFIQKELEKVKMGPKETKLKERE